MYQQLSFKVYIVSKAGLFGLAFSIVNADKCIFVKIQKRENPWLCLGFSLKFVKKVISNTRDLNL